MLTGSLELYIHNMAIAVSGDTSDEIIAVLNEELEFYGDWLWDHRLSSNLTKTKIMS